MLLSGLENLDFSGISGLSGDMSADALFNVFRNAIPQFSSGGTFGFDTGATDTEIRSIINAVLGTYEIKKLSSDPGIGDSVSAFVKPIVISTVGTPRAIRYQDSIYGVLDNLGSQKLYLVPIGYTAQGSVSGGPSSATSVQSMGPVYGTQTYGQPPAPLIQRAPTASPGGFVRSAPPVRYVSRVRAQTPLEKKRLLYIIAGFGVMFAVALGLIAARGGSE
jgi:hypothetical protein